MRPLAILFRMAKYSASNHLDDLFFALSDPTRRAVLAQLQRSEPLSVTELAAPLPIQIPTVLKHLDVLDRAGLIRRSKRGRTVSVRLKPRGTKAGLDWLTRHERFWSSSLDRLTRLVEES